MFRISRLLVLASAAGLLLFAIAAQAADQTAAPKKIRVALITGGHGFDAKALPKIYEGVADLAVDLRMDKDPNAIFDNIEDWKYDVIVLYNFANKITDQQKKNFVKLLDKGVGLFVWHHAFAAYPNWPEFEQLAGVKFWLGPGESNGVKIPGSGARGGVKLKIHIEDPNHPVTKGMSDFDVVDEPYIKQTWAKDDKVLATTENPASDKNIAIVRQQGAARVFALQLGHDAQVWNNPGFRQLWAQGVRWAAGK
jgi:type 1 glutamine amidotransferase